MKRAASVEIPPIVIDRRRRHIARQISEGLRAAIRSGHLKPEDRVPATRTLARVLGVSRQVVVLAYEELITTGHLCGRTGAGSYVGKGGLTSQPLAPLRILEDPDGHKLLVWRLP